MENQDYKLLDTCIRDGTALLPSRTIYEHPLDRTVIKRLTSLRNKIQLQSDDYALFRERDDINELWGFLLEKAIKCLRYFDEREPFKHSHDKKPKAYGIDDLQKYYRKYGDFEKVLYGSSPYYRDHVIHVFRTWLSGVVLLAKNDGICLRNVSIKEKGIQIDLHAAEKISMWTLIALTHDLGYPLEKAKSIIDITKNMLSSFITNPDVSVDFAFHGVQNYMNDYVVRLMSSKMIKKKTASDSPELCYVARLQSKYYFKFQKSLERNRHGILSTLIIYKLLTYFLESDYNINEDYTFKPEDCRQFYIRREILRAIASHTCDDIYQMYMGSFSFLLRICDDTQEWGRKYLSELYVESDQHYELKDIDLRFGQQTKKPELGQPENRCKIQEIITVNNMESTITLVKRFRDQALTYVIIFRDGQDTISRDFSFNRTLEIKYNAITITLVLDINQTQASSLIGKITYVSDCENNAPFGKTYFDDISEKLAVKCEGQIYNESGLKLKPSSPAQDWSTAIIKIPLIK